MDLAQKIKSIFISKCYEDDYRSETGRLIYQISVKIKLCKYSCGRMNLFDNEELALLKESFLRTREKYNAIEQLDIDNIINGTFNDSSDNLKKLIYFFQTSLSFEMRNLLTYDDNKLKDFSFEEQINFCKNY